ncbi:UNVERIFIED_ORG: hypothetical protein BDK47_11628 [Anoxybacillus amylolyticus]
MRKTLCFILACLTIGTSGCSVAPPNEATVHRPEATAIQAVIYNNANDLNHRDIKGYLQDLDISQDEKESIQKTLQALFETSDLTVKITDFRLVSLEKNKAVAQVEQVSSSKTFPELNTRTVLKHEMKKVGRQWKIDKTYVIKSETIQGRESYESN